MKSIYKSRIKIAMCSAILESIKLSLISFMNIPLNKSFGSNISYTVLEIFVLSINFCINAISRNK